MKKGIIIFIVCLFFSSCAFDESFDQVLLEDFKIFQNIIETQSNNLKGNYSEIATKYVRIDVSNFEKYFPFVEKEQSENFMRLFNDDEIQRIDIKRVDRIEFKIRPDFNNSIIRAEWKELWIIYDAQKHAIDTTNIDINELKLEGNWYKVIKTKKRYIGG